MRIGDVATRVGVSPKTLRFYERQGLLPDPPRTDAGYRDYDPATIDRVRFVKDAQASGFTLAQVREILDIRDDGDAPCEHVAAVVDERLAEIGQRLRELHAVREQLEEIAARAATLDPADCDGYCRLIPGRDV